MEQLPSRSQVKRRRTCGMLTSTDPDTPDPTADHRSDSVYVRTWSVLSTNALNYRLRSSHESDVCHPYFVEGFGLELYNITTPSVTQFVNVRLPLQAEHIGNLRWLCSTQFARPLNVNNPLLPTAQCPGRQGPQTNTSLQQNIENMIRKS